MPRSSLKVLRKPVSRCNNSSPRYTRENHYAISCSVYEFLTFSNYKMSITLPYFSKMSWNGYANPNANLIKKFRNPMT